MSVSVEFHFDFASPNAYFSHRVIPAIAERTGVTFEYVPVLLGGLFKATNNKSPMEAFAGIKNKSEYNALETKRFIKQHALTKYQMNPHFPVNTLYIMRAAIQAINSGIGEKYIETVYQAMWEDGANMADAEVIQQVLDAAGLPAEELLASTADPEVKQQLMDSTSASVERGNFGSPTFFVGSEMFFGKDKLRDVEEEILRQK